MEKICAQIFGAKLHHRGSKWANARPASPASFLPLSLKNDSLFSEDRSHRCVRYGQLPSLHKALYEMYPSPQSAEFFYGFRCITTGGVVNGCHTPNTLVDVQRIDCPALLPQTEREQSLFYKFVHVGQKPGTFGRIETGPLLQDHFLQGKLHVQKLCRIVGIHSVPAEEKIHLCIEPVFIGMDEETEMLQFLFLHSLSNVGIAGSFISFNDGKNWNGYSCSFHKRLWASNWSKQPDFASSMPKGRNSPLGRSRTHKLQKYKINLKFQQKYQVVNSRLFSNLLLLYYL